MPSSPKPEPNGNASSAVPDVPEPTAPSVPEPAAAPAAAPVIVVSTLNETIDISGAVITNQQGVTADGSEVTHTTFNTTDLSDVDVTINADLLGVVQKYYNDEADISGSTNMVLNQIKMYASEINCSDFQGKGTVDDYAGLFEAASKIAKDVTHMQLNVDVEGFNEFGAAADELSKLFNSFIVKLETVSIIDDLSFLTSIAAALSKVVNLSNVFGKFKKTILATATIQVPQSSHDATLLIKNVMSEVNCAMTYINHFVNPLDTDPESSHLSSVEQLIINKAVDTIDNWSTLCSQGVTVSMANNNDVQYISTASSQLHQNAGKLTINTSTLKGKLAAYNVLH